MKLKITPFLRKEKIAKAFKEASGDAENLNLAEAGLGDYCEQLNNYEKNRS